jgi:gliding motility-associated lipoprotein GldH
VCKFENEYNGCKTPVETNSAGIFMFCISNFGPLILESLVASFFGTMILRTLLFFSFCLFLLTACDPDYLYEGHRDFPNGVWAYRDTVDFDFEIRDTAGAYNLYIDLSHADTFPFQNLYLKLHTRFPDGRRVSDVQSFDFFDAQGASKGRCSGGKCAVQLNLAQKTRFKQAGNYRITLEQFMRTESTSGVFAVNFAVEKAP